MSHEATNWAINQRGIKPALKVVLWHLCDRYNPDMGCFSSQDTLAYDCEMARSTLNVHLTELEKRSQSPANSAASRARNGSCGRGIISPSRPILRRKDERTRGQNPDKRPILSPDLMMNGTRPSPEMTVSRVQKGGKAESRIWTVTL
ncbi:helix-turn-helix domain-containing protein [Sinorhizobium sp. BJ1]|uniref:helix-turn-helix domain-containing protein n=1 Tax=Sinorhizobium sp. BJ1 TaxID=2035455 RepID=UPI001AECB55E|nr:helix-turn-helix domain-containing protein [Sinorhizobium sp. BJ1]